MTFAVVGHTEWTRFIRVPRVPAPGEIVESSEAWEEAAGGGAVAAVQIAVLTGGCRFLTALGDDELGHRAARGLALMGLDVAVAWRPGPQRQAFVFLDSDGERTITTVGDRMGPARADPLPWLDLDDAEAVYFAAGDRFALRAARGASRLVGTVRAGSVLTEAGVQLDAVVRSAADAGEPYMSGDISPVPRAVVASRGAAGGTIETADGRRAEWAAAPLPGPRVDAHGAGDSFAGGLTVGLGLGRSLEDAVALAARCGAAAVTGRGPYGSQLDASALAR